MAASPNEPNGSLDPIIGPAFGPEQARHLLWRAGFGGPPSQARLLASWGPEKAVDALLNFDQVKGYPGPSAEDFDSTIMKPPSPQERQVMAQARRAQDEDAVAKFRLERQKREREDRRQIAEMQRWWLRRMIETPRPMEEKLTLFWHGHFATGYRTIENSWHMFQQNQLFRKHAAGDFGELLFSIIRDPAMIAYLDNNDSRKGRPNENLARELMELFSLGEGHYSEKDIKEGARALTGYTFEYNDFVFIAERHDADQKTILGRTGNLDGDDFVKAILARRECAEFITFKLYRFFVGDLPERTSPAWPIVTGVIRQLAATLVASRYQLKPMLRRLLLSEHFYDRAIMHGRIKSPAELVVGTIRSLGAPARDLGILNDAMDLMGQSLFYPPSVKGWDGERSWINTSTLFVRQNICNFLITGRTPHGYDPLADSQRLDAGAILEDGRRSGAISDTTDATALASYLLNYALGRDPGPPARQTIAGAISEAGGPKEPAAVTEALALITAMPEYQLC